MASNLKMSNAAVNAEADALSDLLDNGYIRIYSGTQPANADTALSGNTLLAELRAANPASGAAVAGVITFTAPTSDSSNDATGTATFYRALKSDGTSVVMDGSVGTSGADMNLNSTAIQSGAQTDVTSWTHTVPKS
jgi:hypothetical protein